MTRERTAQKSRTRDALLDGARRLMAEGQPVTVPAAAAVHGISRATAYRYFSDASALASEAALAMQVPSHADIVAGCPDLRSQLLAIVAAMVRLTLDNETAFRQFLGHALQAETVSRAGRRVALMRQSVATCVHPLSAHDAERLMASLSVLAGIEAVVALVDVAGMDRGDVPGHVHEMAETLIDAALARASG